MCTWWCTGAIGRSLDVRFTRCCALLHNGLGKATYICVPLSLNSIIWYRPSGGDLFGWESNCEPGGKLQQPTAGFMTNVTCGLTAKKLGSAACPMLVMEYRITYVAVCSSS